jgi:glycine hydroxymethyltransferase
MKKVVDIIDTVLSNKDDDKKVLEMKSEVNDWMKGFPLFK